MDIVERLRSKSTDCHVSKEALYIEAAAEIERLRAETPRIVASIIGLVASYEEPTHWKGSVYEGCGQKAAADILEQIRRLQPMTQALGSHEQKVTEP